MTLSFQVEQACSKQVEPVLRALPEWFGIEKSTVQYIKDADSMPTMLVRDGEEVIGFVTIRMHFPESADIHCMGILPAYHRKGIGRQLVHAVENYLKLDGVKFLQVKTVSDSNQDESYAETRKFYLGVGFTPLEVFPTLWDEWNPALLLIKSLQ